SPFVGASNDALVLLRRAAPRRPLFAGLDRGIPETIPQRDAQLLRAFRQRYDRLAALSARLPLERLCERIVTEHDYDLAVLAQWDGRRRYANVRKLARLARSYEELRGPDVEGFVRFVGDQEAVGARELEAVAEEEGADAVRLLTIHAAKGRESKHGVVAGGGAIAPTRTADGTTPIGWVLGRIDAREELERAGGEPVELEREGARVVVRVDRWSPPQELPTDLAHEEEAQLALFDANGGGAL